VCTHSRISPVAADAVCVPRATASSAISSCQPLSLQTRTPGRISEIECGTVRADQTLAQCRTNAAIRTNASTPVLVENIMVCLCYTATRKWRTGAHTPNAACATVTDAFPTRSQNVRSAARRCELGECQAHSSGGHWGALYARSPQQACGHCGLPVWTVAPWLPVESPPSRHGTVNHSDTRSDLNSDCQRRRPGATYESWHTSLRPAAGVEHWTCIAQTDGPGRLRFASNSARRSARANRV